jgi:hypothetical protein
MCVFIFVRVFMIVTMLMVVAMRVGHVVEM